MRRAIPILVILFSTGAVVAPVTTAAGGCVDYDDHLHYLGPVPGVPEATLVAAREDGPADWAFAADGAGNLVPIDMRVPDEPVVLPGLAMGGEITAIAPTAGGFVLLGVDGVGLAIVASDAEGALALVSTLALGDDPRAVAAAGDVAYVATTIGQLAVVDWSDPQSPVVLGGLMLPFWPRSIAARAHRVFVGGEEWSPVLCVVDATNPEAPAIVDLSTVMPDASDGESVINDIAASDETVVLAYNRIIRLGPMDLYSRIVLISLPADGNFDPATAGVVDIARGSATGVVLEGTHAVICGEGVGVVDIAVPSDPVLLGFAATPGTGWDPRMSGAVCGDVALVSSASGLHRVALADRASPAPTVLATHELPAAGVTAAGTYAYGVFEEVNIPYSGSLALVAFDLADVQAPIVMGTAWYDGTFPPYVGSVRRYRDHVYVGGEWLLVADVSDPAAPVFVGQNWAESGAMAFAGDYLYATSDYYNSPVKVLDISDPSAIETVGTVAGGGAHGVAAANGRLYVTRLYDGDGFPLEVLDLSDPLDPLPLGSWEYDRSLHEIWLHGDLALVRTFDPLLLVLDVKDPQAIALVATIATPTDVRDIAFNGDLAYLDAARAGLLVVDLSEPAEPVLLGGVPTADGTRGVALVDATPIYGDAHDFRAAPAQCVVTAAPDVAHVPPSRLAMSIRPNPFNPRLEINWALPVPAPVRVAIHDARGRLVRAFDLGTRPAGRGSLIWDGSDAAGCPCASGVYHLRLRAGAHTSQRAVTLVR